MKTIIPIIFVFVSLLLVITGCSVPSENNRQNNRVMELSLEQDAKKFEIDGDLANTNYTLSPSDTVARYLFSLQEGRFSEAKGCLAKDFLVQMTDEKLKALGAELDRSRKNFQVVSEEIKGNEAEVTYLFNRVSDNSLEENAAFLVMEDGEWRISTKRPDNNSIKQ